MSVLACAGDPVRLPLVSIEGESTSSLKTLKVVRVRFGGIQRESYEFTEAELKLVARAVLDALTWPDDLPPL